MPPRLSYEDSCLLLQKHQIIAAGNIPPALARPPRHGDAVMGVSFFRTMLADARLERLTLLRTFFSRSEIRGTSFRDTDLSESTANWNDFIEVDFRGADLARSDFRACVFERVRFGGANLAGADFRYCGFTRCDFSDADLTDAKFTTKTGKSLRLASEQQSVIDWHAEDGDEPDGG